MEMKGLVTKAKALLSSLRGDSKLALVFNYPRIGMCHRESPLQTSRAVSESCFKRQIEFLSYLGKFASLDEIREARNLSKLNFAITFDDVSRSVLSVKPYLEAHSIPFAVCPCTDITEEGSESTYLNWEEIKSYFLGNKLVTIVNHGKRDLNLAKLHPGRVDSDIRSSIEDFQKYLDFQPSYFAVPSDKVYQDLAITLNETLHRFNYKGILWESEGSNLIREPYRTQIIHLSRVSASPSFYCFLKVLLGSLRERHRSIIEHIQPVVRRGSFKIISSESPGRAMVLENLLRQGRDDSSDPLFYKYLYEDNPYRDGRPHYYAVESSGQIESILYNFHINFLLDQAPVNGVITAGWRKLPISNDIASGLLLLKALEKEPIVGVYKPSRVAAKALKSLRKVSVHSHRIKVKSHFKRRETPAGHRIQDYDEYCETMDPLTDGVNSSFPFSVERSPAFYRWRYDQYSLASRKYFVLFVDEKPAAYFVTLYKNETLFVSDFFTASLRDFALLLDHTRAFCHSSQIHTIRIETSLHDISDFIQRKFGAEPKVFYNYYHFNTRFPEIRSKWQAVESGWEHMKFHETQACGDVLLR